MSGRVFLWGVFLSALSPLPRSCGVEPSLKIGSTFFVVYDRPESSQVLVCLIWNALGRVASRPVRLRWRPALLWLWDL